MAKILLVEDNLEQATLLSSFLTGEHHVVDVVHSGEDAIHLIGFQSYDLLILDWELPGLSGAEVCENYRTSGGQAAVLMLTGRSDVPSKAIGLDSGADDYLTKPYDFRELAARVRSLLRRPAGLIHNALSADGVQLEVETRTAKIGADSVELTPRECAILEFLIRHANRPYASKALLNAVWPLESAMSEDTVRSCMRHLRTKLATAGGESIIKTVQGLGYVVEKRRQE